MAASDSRLTPLQQDFLHAFFAKPQKFFLSGGGALAGFFLRHRETLDLDLFATPDEDLDSGVRWLEEAAREIGARAETLQRSPDFRRIFLTRGVESTRVDLVIDRVPQIVPDKPVADNVRLDPLREIAANKICALLDRSEVRDLVDLELLLEGGLRLRDVLADAQRKHAGVDAASLAFALDRFEVPASAPSIEGASAPSIERFRQELIIALLKAAVPEREP